MANGIPRFPSQRDPPLAKSCPCPQVKPTLLNSASLPGGPEPGEGAVPAVHHDGPSIRGVAGFHPPEEGQEGRGVLGHAVVGPRCELELPHLALLAGAVLQGRSTGSGAAAPKPAGLWVHRCHSPAPGPTAAGPAHLVQGEGADAERGQFDGVQQGHLDHPVGVCASARPVLVTLYLQGRGTAQCWDKPFSAGDAHSQSALLLGSWAGGREVQESLCRAPAQGQTHQKKLPLSTDISPTDNRLE